MCLKSSHFPNLLMGNSIKYTEINWSILSEIAKTNNETIANHFDVITTILIIWRQDYRKEKGKKFIFNT